METITVKTPPEEPEPGSENPTRIQPVKPLSFSNGFLKLRHPHAPPPPAGVYRECLKNHAAAIGGHAVDGCGEFLPAAASLLCAACGCHRNFHRRDPTSPHAPPPPTQLVEYQPHHRHHPPPPPRSPPSSASPPPISSAYYPSMLLSLSSPNPNPNSKKRFRTKFTVNQKEKMQEFAEKLTWKMQRRDDDVINEFCNGIGVEKGVFKVWMHNNKNTMGNKKDHLVGINGVNLNGINLDNTPNGVNYHRNDIDEVSTHPVCTNGSSSSS